MQRRELLYIETKNLSTFFFATNVLTKEKFSTTELDCFNTLQVYKQYKKRFNTSRGEKA